MLALLFLVSLSSAQSGDDFMKKKDYLKAMVNYEREVRLDPSKYLNLAQCYFSQKQFDKAIDALKLYKEKDSKANKDLANKWLELLERNDDPTRLVNIGSKINTSKEEYYPVVSGDGKRLYYIGSEYTNGQGGEDIWYADKQPDGTWGEPKNFSQINTTSHESIMAISADGNTAIVFGNYKGSFGSGDLFYSVKTGDGWSMPCNLGGTINTKNWESQASLGPDGKTLMFCSDRDDKGFSDIYVSFLTDDGWAKPIGLGSSINPQGSFQGGPTLAADNKTLYFFSKGHGGFGGADLFMAKRLDDSWTNWSQPVNLGKYINTLEDDKYMTIPASGNKAYTIIDDARDGYGGMDLYEFIMPLSMRPEKTFTIKGRTYNEVDSAEGVVIRYLDFETGKEISRASSSKTDGNYYVSLPAFKKYKVVIDMKGFLYFEDILDLSKPELYANKISIQEKMGTQQLLIKDIKIKLDQCNVRLQQMLDSKGTNLQDEFEKYTKLVEEYKGAIAQLDQAVYKAKSDWLSEENNLELTLNYQLTRIKIGARFELKNIFFDLGKATLRQESMKELDKLVDIMNRSEIVIELGGHTDNVGTDEANNKLSQDRVTSVKTYLASKGVNESRMTAVGYGESQPIASNDNDEGRQKNRRVEVKITEIRPREGSGDYIKNEEEKKKEAARFDMLSALQRAAKIGGVPEGSFCSDKVTYIDKTYKPDSKKYYGNDIHFDPSGFGLKPIEKSEFHLKTFNASLINYGFKNNYTGHGGILGVGVAFVKGTSDNRIERHINVYAKGDSIFKGGLGYVSLNNFRIYKNVVLVAGSDITLFTMKNTPTTNGGKLQGTWTLPVGFRYLMKATDGVVLVPEAWYQFALMTGKEIKNWTANNELVLGKGSYMHIGVNARAKILQGGVFYNYGSAIRYAGFRAGIAF
jgi:outer membrane protein OmpA-like peptidoglycan-associated protein